MDPVLPTLLSPSDGEDSNDNDSMSDANQIDEEVIEYLRNLSAIEPDRERKIQSHLKTIRKSTQSGLQINTFIDDTLIGTNYEDTPANGLLMEDVGLQNFSPRYEYPQDNEQKEILVTNHVEERAENSTLVEPPETMEAKKGKLRNITWMRSR